MVKELGSIFLCVVDAKSVLIIDGNSYLSSVELNRYEFKRYTRSITSILEVQNFQSQIFTHCKLNATVSWSSLIRLKTKRKRCYLIKSYLEGKEYHIPVYILN